MNEDVISDLKQFIATTVSQQTSTLTDRLDAIDTNMATKDDLTKLDKKLSTKIDDLQASVGEALDTSNNAIDAQLQDHAQRLTHLEQKTA